MVFSSIMFLFCFLPIGLGLYYLAPKRLKNTVLFAISLIFYSWGEVRYFPIMLSVIVVNYIAAILMEKRPDDKKWRLFWLMLSVVFNFGMLGFFKYAGFIAENREGAFVCNKG